ncbi:MAG: hypothetical protein Q9217_002563 [Psora testacea]
MLSHSSSNASAKIRRAKSASAVRPRSAGDQYAGLGNERLAHYHAVTAAELAFRHAKELRRGRRAGKERESVGAIANGTEGPGLSMQKSIRFAGPSAVPMRSCSITRRNALEYKPGLKARGSGTFSDDYSTEADQSTRTSLTMVSTQGAEEFIEHGPASQPSSYRKLRKAKSMFMPGKTPCAVLPNGMPLNGSCFQRPSARSVDSWGEPTNIQAPRLRKSLSFLRGVVDRLPTNNRLYATNDEAVQLARDQYRRQLEQQRLKEPSFFNIVKRHRSQKVFRRTVRTSGTNSYGNAIESPKAPKKSLQPGDLGQKARSFSLNVKRRLKQAFRRSLSGEESMPAQHLEASRAHYGDGPSTFERTQQSYPPVPSPDAGLLRSVESRESILRNSPVFVEQNSNPGSIRSVPSQEDLSMNKSRVTSWTNSTADNTINLPTFMERKRLSVIKEDGGPHQPSSSARQTNDIATGYAAFGQPFRPAIPGSPPEPQRVFSALRREIIKRSSHPDFDGSDSGTQSSLEQAWPRRSYGTLGRSSSGHLINSEPFTFPTAHLDYTEATEDLTPQQIAILNETGGTLPKRPLHEVGSVFFHAHTHIEQKEGISPFRRALHNTGVDDMSSRYESPLADTSQDTGPFESMAAQYHSGSRTRSESVYSRTSGGHTPKAVGSSVSLMKSEISEQPGTAVVLAADPTRCGGTGRSPALHRDFSDRTSKSSGQWRKRLASDILYFEDRTTGDESIYKALPVKGSGHKREGAQLDGDDVAIGTLPRPRHSPKQPFGSTQPTANAPFALKRKLSQPVLKRFSSFDMAESPKPATPPQNENAPPLPGVLQAQHSTTLESGQDAFSAYRSSVGVPQISSPASLMVRNENVQSPASSNSRHSPDRAERIRRLKNKSSLPLQNADCSPNLAIKGDLSGNRAAFNTSQASSNPWLRSNNSKENIPCPNQTPSTAVGNKQLVEDLLKGGQREMRLSEVSVGNSAFL